MIIKLIVAALVVLFFIGVLLDYSKDKNRNKKTFHKYGLKPDKKDERDFLFGVCRPVSVPESVDLSGTDSPVVDQGIMNSCTANAIVSGLFEAMWLKAGRTMTRFSRMFLYYNEREKEGDTGVDEGACIRDGMKSLTKQGVCLEESWKYHTGNLFKKPVDSAYKEALNYKIISYSRVIGLQQVKQCLAQGNRVVLGMKVYESFESGKVANTGIVPMPKKKEQCLGGHAVEIVGYDNSLQRFKLRNSWGICWGDKGYFYIPYTVFPSLAMDMWTADTLDIESGCSDAA